MHFYVRFNDTLGHLRAKPVSENIDATTRNYDEVPGLQQTLHYANVNFF